MSATLQYRREGNIQHLNTVGNGLSVPSGKTGAETLPLLAAGWLQYQLKHFQMVSGIPQINTLTSEHGAELGQVGFSFGDGGTAAMKRFVTNNQRKLHEFIKDAHKQAEARRLQRGRRLQTGSSCAEQVRTHASTDHPVLMPQQWRAFSKQMRSRCLRTSWQRLSGIS